MTPRAPCPPPPPSTRQVLRLTASAVSAISMGHVVNLVSNDVRRFDDALTYWVFVWSAPLELAMVFIMVRGN